MTNEAACNTFTLILKFHSKSATKPLLVALEFDRLSSEIPTVAVIQAKRTYTTCCDSVFHTKKPLDVFVFRLQSLTKTWGPPVVVDGISLRKHQVV
jgi:hypothetical protein